MFESLHRTFTLVFTMRSGSNAICDLLTRNGIGAPTEWFQQPLLANDGETWLESFTRFIDCHQAQGTFGCKMSHDHRARLDESLRAAIPGYVRLDDILPAHRWVWLTRRDKVLQAISLCRAETSGRWALTEADLGPPGNYEYDYFHVLSRVLMIQAAELTSELYFQQHGIEPYKIVYEDFFADVEGGFPRLVEYLGGLPAGRTVLEFGQSFQVQRDEVNYALRERFVSDLQRIGESGFAEELGEANRRWMHFFFDRQWRAPQEPAASADGGKNLSDGEKPRRELPAEGQPELHARAG